MALVHDWMTGMRGGEVVFEAIAELFPKAHLFTLLYVPGTVSPALRALPRTVSRLQSLPAAAKRYRHYLPLMPHFIEQLDLSGYDLVISSSHCVAKGVRKDPGAKHLSYVHSPMRYVWDRYDDYFGPGRASWMTRMAARSVRSYLQNWDRSTSGPERIDRVVANSGFVSQRIREVWGRESSVVHPFADLSRFSRPRSAGRNYLMVGAFAPYKRVDLAIQAFNQLKLPLLIVGSGQDEERLKKIAGPTIDFLGSLSNESIADLYSKSKAMIFPGIEDFGITPLESMAAGTPVIALRAGGAAETVTDQTGVFFEQQTVDSLIEAVLKLERGEVELREQDCRQRALEFTRESFQRKFLAEVAAMTGESPQIL